MKSRAFKEDLLKKIRSLPQSPGVYLMKDLRGKVLYIGKAADLRGRVAQYFGGSDTRHQIALLMKRVADVDFIVTYSDKEALLLESSLIKEYQPRYNIDLRDDKNFLSLRIDPFEKFPRLSFVRKIKDDGARYFGPFTSAKGVREAVRYLYRIFPLRNCSDSTFRRRTRPCLRYDIDLCSAPCVGKIDENAYRKLVEELIAFLEGKSSEIEKKIEDEMWRASENMNYERAAELRDRLAALRAALEEQRIVDIKRPDADIFGIWSHENKTAVCIVFFRKGSVVGKDVFLFSDKIGSEVEKEASFIEQYYLDPSRIPGEIVISSSPDYAAVLEEILSNRAGRKVRVKGSLRGKNRKLVMFAVTNAKESVFRSLNVERRMLDQLEAVASKLKLSRVPRKMECYDVSQMQGDFVVAARAVFIDGKPAGNLYRLYKIKGKSDDFSALSEVVARRIRRKEEDPLPDLMVVDGGRAQLSVLERSMKDVDKNRPDIAAIAKERRKNRTKDRIFIPGRKNPVEVDGKPLSVISALRDEAHRFALEYHRKLRSKGTLKSILSEIKGVGAARERAILEIFGNIENLKKTDPADLSKKAKIPLNIAERIISELSSRSDSEKSQ